jgi:hypothetical protein
MTTTYNGWKNYETWNVKLWLDNDQGTAEYWAEVAEQIFEDATEVQYRTKSESARYDLADQLKDELEDQNPLNNPPPTWSDEVPSASMWHDLLGAAFSEVDWHEIANAFLEDIDCGYRPREKVTETD